MRHLLACIFVALASAATAQTAPPATAPAQPAIASPALEARTRDVVAMLAGKGEYDSIFSAAFREKVPKAQFDAVSAQITASAGAVTGVEKLTPDTAWSGTILMGFQHAVATMRIAVDPAEPHQVTGLLVTGMTQR
jgi:hypothetical protein